MPEAFLISTALSPLTVSRSIARGAAKTPPSSAALGISTLNEAVQAAGLDRGKIEAVYWGGDPSLRSDFTGQGWGAVIGIEAGELSSQLGVHLAAQAILAGDLDLALAGGMASRTGYARAPSRELLVRADAWAVQQGLNRKDLDEAVARAAAQGPDQGEALSILDGAPVEAELSPPENQNQVAEVGAGVTPGHFLPPAMGAGVVLLASARAVGGLNLSPRAGIMRRTFLSVDSDESWSGGIHAARQALRGAGVDFEDVDRVRVAASFVGVEAALKKVVRYDADHLLPMGAFFGPVTGIIGLIGLVEALEGQQSRLGLLVGAAENGTAAATLVERI